MTVRPASSDSRGRHHANNGGSQDAPGSLSRSQNADLLAFLLRENGYPAASVDELRQNDDAWFNEILIEP